MKNYMRRPGIEPGSLGWEPSMLTPILAALFFINNTSFNLIFIQYYQDNPLLNLKLLIIVVAS